MIELTEKEIKLLLERIEADSIKPYKSGTSLHVHQYCYLIDEVKYAFYWALGYDEHLPTVEIIK
jgi:hypothetical protein